MKAIVTILGVILIVVAAVYFLVPAELLPSFFPGHETGLLHSRQARDVVGRARRGAAGRELVSLVLNDLIGQCLRQRLYDIIETLRSEVSKHFRNCERRRARWWHDTACLEQIAEKITIVIGAAFLDNFFAT